MEFLRFFAFRVLNLGSKIQKIDPKMKSEMGFVFFGSKSPEDAPQDAARRFEDAARRPQDAPRCTKMLSRSLQESPRRTQDGPRTAPRQPQNAPKMPPRPPKSHKSTQDRNLDDFGPKTRWEPFPQLRCSRFVGPFWYNFWCQVCAQEL